MDQDKGKTSMGQIAYDNPPDWRSYRSDRNQALFILAFLVPMYLWMFWDGVTIARIVLACFLSGFILLMASIPIISMLNTNKNRPTRVILLDSGLRVEFTDGHKEYDWRDVRGVSAIDNPTIYSFMGKPIELHGVLVLSTGKPLKVTYQIAKDVSEHYKERFGVYPARYCGEWGNSLNYKALQK